MNTGTNTIDKIVEMGRAEIEARREREEEKERFRQNAQEALVAECRDGVLAAIRDVVPAEMMPYCHLDDLNDGTSLWSGATFILPGCAPVKLNRRQNKEAPMKHGRGFELTPRERQVAELIAAGLTNPEIAERLDLKRETIKSHVWHVMRKLGVTDREEVRELMASDGKQTGRVEQPPRGCKYTDLDRSTQLFLERLALAERQSMLRHVTELHDKLHTHGNHIQPDDVVEILSSIGLLMLSRDSLRQARIINLARREGLIHRNGDER